MFNLCFLFFSVSMSSPQTTSAPVFQRPDSIFNFNTILVFKITRAAHRNRSAGRLSQPEKATTRQHIPNRKRPRRQRNPLHSPSPAALPTCVTPAGSRTCPRKPAEEKKRAFCTEHSAWPGQSECLEALSERVCKGTPFRDSLLSFPRPQTALQT